MKIVYLFWFLAFGAYACTPAVIATNGTKQPWSADYTGDAPGGIAFLKNQDSIPAVAIKLATTTVLIPDISSLPDGQCFLQTRRLALLEAKRIGGNLVHLVRPTYSAKRLEVEIYRVTTPLPERPGSGKCTLFVTADTFSGVRGDLLLNDSVLFSYPVTRKSVQEFKVDTGDFLSFREADAPLCTGVYLPYGGTYDVFIGYNRRYRYSYLSVVPWDMYFPTYYPDSLLSNAQFVKPERSPALIDSARSSGDTVVIHLSGHFPRGLTGGLYFNGKPLIRFPITAPQKEYSFVFHENGMLTYRGAGSFYAGSVVLEKGQEYQLKIKRTLGQSGAHVKVLDQQDPIPPWSFAHWP